MDEEDSEYSEYISKIIRNIKGWKNESPGVVSYLIGTATAPVTWLMRLMIPEAAIQGALAGVDWIGKNTTTAPGAANPDDFKSCNEYADRTINFHIAVATTEGGIAGFFGLPAMAVDIPAVILLAMRLIRQIGCEYGFDADTEEERQFVYSVISSASANSQEDKIAAIAANAHILNLLLKNTWKGLGEKAVSQQIGGAAAITAVRNLAKQLGINITKRNALAVIPFIGAVVGASANGWFVREVGVAAQNLYQERWLKEHDRWIEDPYATS
jgi:hypothetical protein